jgi:hypothetical protein
MPVYCFEFWDESDNPKRANDFSRWFVIKCLSSLDPNDKKRAHKKYAP